MTGYIYFIQASLSKKIKIGYSSKPSRRLKNLQTANTENLTLLKKVSGSRLQESFLHDYFSGDRIEGDLFLPCDSLTSLINSNKTLEKINEMMSSELDKINKAGEIYNALMLHEVSSESILLQGFSDSDLEHSIAVFKDAEEMAKDTRLQVELMFSRMWLQHIAKDRLKAQKLFRDNPDKSKGWVVCDDGEQFFAKGSLENAVNFFFETTNYIWLSSASRDPEAFKESVVQELSTYKFISVKHNQREAIISYSPFSDYSHCCCFNPLHENGEWNN